MGSWNGNFQRQIRFRKGLIQWSIKVTNGLASLAFCLEMSNSRSQGHLLSCSHPKPPCPRIFNKILRSSRPSLCTYLWTHHRGRKMQSSETRSGSILHDSYGWKCVKWGIDFSEEIWNSLPRKLKNKHWGTNKRPLIQMMSFYHHHTLPLYIMLACLLFFERILFLDFITPIIPISCYFYDCYAHPLEDYLPSAS